MLFYSTILINDKPVFEATITADYTPSATRKRSELWARLGAALYREARGLDSGAIMFATEEALEALEQAACGDAPAIKEVISNGDE